MDLTENQESIEEVIRYLTSGDPGFCTVEDIDAELGISKQTVHNNIDAVVEAYDDIGVRKVGQANVYYVKTNRMDEIFTENSRSVKRLSLDSDARYAELRHAEEDSRFDLEVHWYDSEANELESYSPSLEDVGLITRGSWSEPVRIRIAEK